MKPRIVFATISLYLIATNGASAAPAKVSAVIDWEKHKIHLAAEMQVGQAELARGNAELRRKLRTALISRLSSIAAAEWHKVSAGEGLDAQSAPDLAEYWALLKLASFQISENKASATMEVTLRGKDSMLASLPVIFDTASGKADDSATVSEAYEKRPNLGAFDASQSEPIKYSGLVVDARHLPFEPALTVNIFTSSGRLIYGASELNRVTAVKRGVAGFFKHETEGEARARAGKRPLKVSALDMAAGGVSGLVVSDEDAAKLMAHTGSQENLRRARVVILVQPGKLKERF